MADRFLAEQRERGRIAMRILANSLLREMIAKWVKILVPLIPLITFRDVSTADFAESMSEISAETDWI